MTPNLPWWKTPQTRNEPRLLESPHEDGHVTGRAGQQGFRHRAELRLRPTGGGTWRVSKRLSDGLQLNSEGLTRQLSDAFILDPGSNTQKATKLHVYRLTAI